MSKSTASIDDQFNMALSLAQFYITVKPDLVPCLFSKCNPEKTACKPYALDEENLGHLQYLTIPGLPLFNLLNAVALGTSTNDDCTAKPQDEVQVLFNKILLPALTTTARSSVEPYIQQNPPPSPPPPPPVTFINVKPTVSYYGGNPYNCGNPGDPRNLDYTDSTSPNNIKRVGGSNWDMESALKLSYPNQQAEAIMEFTAVTATANSISCSSNADCTQSGTVCGTAKLASFVRKCGQQIGWWTAKYMCDAVPTFKSTIVDCTGRNADLYKCQKGGSAPHPCDNALATTDNCCGCVEWLTLTPPVLVVSGKDLSTNIPYTQPCGGNNGLANPLWLQNIFPQVLPLKQCCPDCYTDPFGDKSATFTCRCSNTGVSINQVNYMIVACPQIQLNFATLNQFVGRLTDYTDGSRHIVFFNNCPFPVAPAITSGNVLRAGATVDGDVQCSVQSQCPTGAECIFPKPGCQPNTLTNLFNLCGGSLCTLTCPTDQICVNIPGNAPACYPNDIGTLLNSYNNICSNSAVCGDCPAQHICIQLPGQCFWKNPQPEQGSSYLINSGAFSTFMVNGANPLSGTNYDTIEAIAGKKGLIWNGKFTFRAGCDATTYKCDIADCESKGSGASQPFECTAGPLPPTTVAELALNELAGKSDFFDVSVMDGFGVYQNTVIGMSIMPFINGAFTVADA